MDKELKDQIIDVLEDALRFEAEALARHDLELGRTTDKNREHAEWIESCIKRVETLISKIVKL